LPSLRRSPATAASTGWRRSTAPTSRRTAPQPAEKGGFRASARHLARRADQQAARRDRRNRTATTDPADRRQRLRCGDRTGAAGCPRAVSAPCRRPRLRQRCHPPADCRAGRRGRHPAQLPARAPNPLRPHRLSPAKPRRAAVVSPQRLASRRDPIRQTRPQLPRQRLSCSRPHILDQLSPDPRTAGRWRSSHHRPSLGAWPRRHPPALGPCRLRCRTRNQLRP
jgi:hypothetical protein